MCISTYFSSCDIRTLPACLPESCVGVSRARPVERLPVRASYGRVKCLCRYDYTGRVYKCQAKYCHFLSFACTGFLFVAEDHVVDVAGLHAHFQSLLSYRGVRPLRRMGGPPARIPVGNPWRRPSHALMSIIHVSQLTSGTAPSRTASSISWTISQTERKFTVLFRSIHVT